MCAESDLFVALSPKLGKSIISTHSTVSFHHTYIRTYDWLSNKTTKTETDCNGFVACASRLFSHSWKKRTHLIKRIRATELEICMRTYSWVCVCEGMIKCVVIKENVS